jgi:hypothetical protein
VAVAVAQVAVAVSRVAVAGGSTHPGPPGFESSRNRGTRKQLGGAPGSSTWQWQWQGGRVAVAVAVVRVAVAVAGWQWHGWQWHGWQWMRGGVGVVGVFE